MYLVLREREPYTTLDGSLVWELIRPEDGSSRVSVARAFIAEGQRTYPHMHRTSEEVYYILRGQGVVVVGGQEHPVAPGDAVLIPAGAEHFAFGVGGPLELLAICAPPYRHDDTDLTEALA